MRIGFLICSCFLLDNIFLSSEDLFTVKNVLIIDYLVPCDIYCVEAILSLVGIFKQLRKVLFYKKRIYHSGFLYVWFLEIIPEFPVS